MDADYNPEEAQETKKTKVTRRKNTRHRSKFSKALEKKRPVFDPNEKDFASYYDEYYQLDFEDVVGGIPCRFKYRKVEPNNCSDRILTCRIKSIRSPAKVGLVVTDLITSPVVSWEGWETPPPPAPRLCCHSLLNHRRGKTSLLLW